MAMKDKVILCGFPGYVLLALLAGLTCGERVAGGDQNSQFNMERYIRLFKTSNTITMFVCGDVMTGRGIDQVLPHPSTPVLHEPYVRRATRYVELAERANGHIPKPVSFSYPWGAALEELERVNPDLRMINLETSVTTSNDYWRGKGIHYRMHPKNIACLTEAKIDYCSLANNHVLDWGYGGLVETLETLRRVNISIAGAGQNLQEAETPAVMEVGDKGRVIVSSYGLQSSGIPRIWAASESRPGVNLLRSLSDPTIQKIKEQVEAMKQQHDIVVASIHWGGNWGYNIRPDQREFAHKLIDRAGVDFVHGHSSHHVKGIGVHKDRLIIYGSGDFLNDYEGIDGYESFRGDLALMYFVSMDSSTGKLIRLDMTPVQIKHFRTNRASRADVLWLKDILNREGKNLGTRVEIDQDNTLTLKWN
jgi:poly-gamma-glutamate synthesis protein (capsule biosynthesis protein)